MIQALIAAGVSPFLARQFDAPLAAACARFGINTPRRIATFVAQCAVESGGFTMLEENLRYTTPARIRDVWPSRFKTAADAAPFAMQPKELANRVYAGKNGNGDESSGDGWRYRGRGLKQLTGRGNYREAAGALGVNYEASPDLVALPEHACLTAAWFWRANGCGDLADAGNWDAITRKVNGPAMLRAKDRRVLASRALAVLDVSDRMVMMS